MLSDIIQTGSLLVTLAIGLWLYFYVLPTIKLAIEPMPRSRKIDLEKVQASLDKTCPKCGCTIKPDQVKRVDSKRVECPKCRADV